MDNEFIIEEVSVFSPDLTDAIKHLVHQLASNAQSLTDVDIQTLIASPNTSLFVARNTTTNNIVGMITLVSYRIPYAMKGILEDLVVDENARGKGLGEKLLSAAITKAKTIGVTSLMLTSQPTRESANRLYQKLGFEQHHTNVYRVKL